MLFGKPPVSALKQALAKLSACNSISQLRQLFGSCIPDALLAADSCGDNSRRRVFSLDVVFWAFLDQVQTPAGSCREAVRKVMAFLRRKAPRDQTGSMSPDTSAYCQARAKIPLQVIDQISAHLVERMQKNIPAGGLWHGRRVKLVDGTGVSMPDTAANQGRWPQSTSQKPGCGFPSMNIVAIFCLCTGALIKAATGKPPGARGALPHRAAGLPHPNGDPDHHTSRRRNQGSGPCRPLLPALGDRTPFS